MLNTRRSVTALLALVFAVNYVETSAEGWFRKSSYLSNDRRYQNAEAAHWLEGYTTFEYQEATGPIAVYGYSAAYFFLFPLLGLGLLLALARRKDMSGYRKLAIAAALDYSISVPFYVFFPVPERWAYPEAMATLLSDQWDARLIAAIRPMSGLDNCFPSFHVSLTVIIDRKSTRLNSSHANISYAVFCL